MVVQTDSVACVPPSATRHFSGRIPDVLQYLSLADLDTAESKSPYQGEIDLTLTHTPG